MAKIVLKHWFPGGTWHHPERPRTIAGPADGLEEAGLADGGHDVVRKSGDSRSQKLYSVY